MDDDTCVETCQKIDRLEEMNVKLKQVKGLPSVRIAKGNPNKIMHDSNRVIIPPICVRSYANIYRNFFFFLTIEKKGKETNCSIFIYDPLGNYNPIRYAYYLFIQDTLAFTLQIFRIWYEIYFAHIFKISMDQIQFLSIIWQQTNLCQSRVSTKNK